MEAKIAGTQCSGAPVHRPFEHFAAGLRPQSPLRAAVTAATRRAEPECVEALLESARTPAPAAAAIEGLARSLATKVRERNVSSSRNGLTQGVMQEFALSSEEGVALMCVAEALLRIPDAATRNALIRDKVNGRDWHSHLGRSESVFVNAASWGLYLTGKLVATHSEGGLSNALTQLLVKHGEPVLRKGVEIAMRLMAEQFVSGETIQEALAGAAANESRGFRYSYDMLGEAAVTANDAARYFASYEEAIHAIGKASEQRGIYLGPGISIKLSALHPRYTRPQRERVMEELYPRLYALTLLARQYDIGVNIDAEEADRLDLSLDLLERLCHESALAGGNGIGFVVQAYQKRAPFVIDWLIDLARKTRRRLMLRLVKGAYWDSEIKRAQVDGMPGYAVYTRKVHTDVSYLACARKMLAVPDALYPQFATHNAHTLAAIYHLAGANYYPGQYELQCLHGMGEALYDHVVAPAAEGGLDRPCRIYAPVGTQQTLLPYLVRRLLENGANTSFVNRISDPAIALDELVADPVREIEKLRREEGAAGLPHLRIPLPRDLYGEARVNSAGVDLTDEAALRELAAALTANARVEHAAGPTLSPGTSTVPVRNPAAPDDIVGAVTDASDADVERALEAAHAAAPAWQAVSARNRAAILERAADAMEADMASLMALLVREAGKSYADAVGEVREAVDFLRYYAAEVRASFSNETHRALGPVACISPWNFPLAIFTGQLAAALAAGNTVVAKPAEQTPLIAASAVRMLHASGIPNDVLQLLPGGGETVGAKLVTDPRVQGVMFTGSTDVARILQRTLARRVGAFGAPVPLVAETGGQNAMICDSSALAEQVVADAVASAFDSAGQRCSALRVLCVQEDIAERLLEMVRGAMAELHVGNPDDIAVDVGPLIDEHARAGILEHIDAMRAKGHRVYQVPSGLPSAGKLTKGNPRFPSVTSHPSGQAHPHPNPPPDGEGIVRRGYFVAPTLIEIDRVSELEREVFGPVLHVVRYPREALDTLVDEINALGFGLTLGVHSRIDERIARVVERARVGNIYVNRNMIGAVVGVQPFGGEGLSGTGPKAGGPLYLYRLLSDYPRDAVIGRLRALAPDALGARAASPAADAAAFESLRAWCASGTRSDCALPQSLFGHLVSTSPAGTSYPLPGPTGESNTYMLHARDGVLGIAETARDSVAQLAAVLALGSNMVWHESGMTRALFDALPEAVRERVMLVPQDGDTSYDAVLYHGGARGLEDVLAMVAGKTGPVVPVSSYPAGDDAIRLERLCVERVISVNTAAAGGNATLMTVG